MDEVPDTWSYRDTSLMLPKADNNGFCTQDGDLTDSSVVKGDYSQPPNQPHIDNQHDAVSPVDSEYVPFSSCSVSQQPC